MSWTKNRSAQESLVILRELSVKCSELGGPLAKKLLDLVNNKDYRTLVNYEIDYSDENLTVADATYSRQILGLYQKCEFLKIGYNVEEEAARRFVKSERMCLEANLRFELIDQHPNLVDADVMDVLLRSQRKIQSILGPCPKPLSELKFEYGTGANTNVKRADACPRAKLSAQLECSTNLFPVVASLLSEVPALAEHHAVHGSSNNEELSFLDRVRFLDHQEANFLVDVSLATGLVMFVSKNAKTKRTIVLEPPLNTLMQKGYGTEMKRLLLASGINLYDQSINQRFALLGSVSGEVATEDASMASDCVCRGLVWNQLPYCWAEALDHARTPYVRLPESVTADIVAEQKMDKFMVPGWRPYSMEKFSSMGCAFTFELESVIFYGLCFAVTEALGLDTKMVSIYGDDMIVPVEAHSLLVRVLKFCGFSLNLEKSFASGPFRESCGADYFHGFDIRPYYQKTKISGQSLFVMHNWFVRHCEFELARVALRYCREPERLWGPDGYGDGHLIGSYDVRPPKREHRRAGYDGSYFDTYILGVKHNIQPMPGDRVLPAYSVYTRSGADSPTDPYVVPGSADYTKVSIYTLSRNIFPRIGEHRDEDEQS